MKKLALFFAGLAFLFLASCSRPPQTSQPGERIAWQNKTLTQSYESIGSRSPKWDEPATNAVAAFARARAGEGDATYWVNSAGEFAEQAVNAGCDDPLVLYLYCRFAPARASKPFDYWKNEYRKAAQGMQNRGYPPLLKFYANDRAADVVWQTRDQSIWQEVVDFRRAAMNDLEAALQDKSTPIEDVAEACDALEQTISVNEKEMADAYAQIEPPLFKNWPNTSTAYFIKGKFYLSFAWKARGGGYANQVTEEGWKGFREKLSVADAAFRKAWSLNPKDSRVPTQMIEIAVCLQRDRNEMELWFKRGMELNTNDYELCSEKLRYLKPEWYGSCEDMVAFGRQCVASNNWGGRVPLVLADAHYYCAQKLEKDQRADYWHQPDVWPDMQSAYERFFELNEDASSFRYSYAYYAYACGQYREFNAQMKLIRDKDGKIDTAFFGGEDAFGKMMERASEGVPKDQN